MPVDLDALSREVAAAGDGWMVPGVDMHTAPSEYARIFECERGSVFALTHRGQFVRFTIAADIRPNLRDPVTVNALLEDRMVVLYHGSIVGTYYWSGSMTGPDGSIGPDRTTAICRAWIAARGKK